MNLQNLYYSISKSYHTKSLLPTSLILNQMELKYISYQYLSNGSCSDIQIHNTTKLLVVFFFYFEKIHVTCFIYVYTVVRLYITCKLYSWGKQFSGVRPITYIQAFKDAGLSICTEKQLYKHSIQARILHNTKCSSNHTGGFTRNHHNTRPYCAPTNAACDILVICT